MPRQSDSKDIALPPPDTNIRSVLTEVAPRRLVRCFLFQGLDADSPHCLRPLL